MQPTQIPLTPDTQLTKHFQLGEFLKLAKRPDNIPTLTIVTNLQYGCALILEPLRQHLQCPVIINSGYRNTEYNFSVGGVTNSQHLQGCAADIKPANSTAFTAMVTWLKACKHVDQLITARSGWLHVSWTPTGTPRRQYLPNYYQ